jgi:hypothetical protein
VANGEGGRGIAFQKGVSELVSERARGGGREEGREGEGVSGVERGSKRGLAGFGAWRDEVERVIWLEPWAKTLVSSRE